jgi:DNA-binding transcriptional regulator YiaG
VPNLAAVLKMEIRRLARKEARASTAPLRKIVASLRKRVAAQRRTIKELERTARRSVATVKMAAAASAPEAPQVRFSPAWVRKHRKKLKMSRRIYAKLVGVSAQSIFGWESGRTRPRRAALASWRRLRSMGAREIKALLDAGRPGRGGKRGAGRMRGAGRKRAKPARRKLRAVRRKARGARRSKKK